MQPPNFLEFMELVLKKAREAGMPVDDFELAYLDPNYKMPKGGTYHDFPQEQCHPDTKELLADPFYWDAGDDYAPHGSDNGADTLSSFIEWRKHKATKSSQIFIEEHLSNWDIHKIETQTEREIERDVIVAVAFAKMKIDGHCPKWLQEEALKLILKEKEDVIKNPAKYYKEVPDYYNKLERALVNTPTVDTP